MRISLRMRRRARPTAREEQEAWLSWMKLGGARPATIKGYRWTTDRLLARYSKLRLDQFTDEWRLCDEWWLPATTSTRLLLTQFALWMHPTWEASNVDDVAAAGVAVAVFLEERAYIDPKAETSLGRSESDVFDIARKFTLAEAALRDIAAYPQPSDGRRLREIARSALEGCKGGQK